MTPTDTVNEAAELLRARIRELDQERNRLQRALASLTGGREGRRGPGRPRGKAAGSPSRRRRRRRGGTRAEQAQKLIGENPGIGASDIARRLGIKPNYMYRVLAELQQDGKVRKEGRSYHAA